MVHHLNSFITIPKTTNLKILFAFCWFTLITGTVLYIFELTETVIWTYHFPYVITLTVAMFVMSIALRFYTCWLPIALVFLHWRWKSTTVLFVYWTGCVFAIGCSIAVIVLITPYYMIEGRLRDEFLNDTKYEINTHGHLPSWVKGDETHVCCGWTSPTDIGTVVVINENHVEQNLKLMTEVAQCYGKLFNVSKVGAQVAYSNVFEQHTKPLPGCAPMIQEQARTFCLIIFWLSLVIIFSALLCMILFYSYYHFEKLTSAELRKTGFRNESVQTDGVVEFYIPKVSNSFGSSSSAAFSSKASIGTSVNSEYSAISIRGRKVSSESGIDDLPDFIDYDD